MIDPKLTLLGSLIFLIAFRVPIGFALGLSSLLTVWQIGLPPLIVAQRMAAGINSFPLLAIPFFIFAGQIMVEGGMARRIVEMARVLVGPFRGGLAMVNVVDSMLFGGVSGSAVADVSATGSIVIPMMVKAGYDRDFSVALTVATSTQGIIIPPSHNAVIYSMVAGGVSIGGLFLAGYIPGVLIGLSLMVASYLIAVRRDYPREPFVSLGRAARALGDGFLAVLAGLVVIGGIVSGIFTATEAAAIAAIYALVISAFVYRELPWKGLRQALYRSVLTIASVVFIIATASAFGWLMAYLRIPALLTEALLSLTESRILLLLLINLLLIFLGCIMDMAPLIIILTPILLPVVKSYGVDPIHFGIILLMNLALGLTTPPVGTALFVGCAVGGAKIEEVSRALLYLWPPMLVVLLIVTFWPGMVLWLPRLFGMG